MKTDRIIDKFMLRAQCAVGGKVGQKMDEDCIQRLIAGDPSGRGKYLEWMLCQAGGGKQKYDLSVAQWEEGSHGEESIKDQLRRAWIKEAEEGYTDDDGKAVSPVSKAQALLSWTANEAQLKEQHIFGDEDFLAYGGFGFYRSWPGGEGLYELIIKSVRRFHKHRASLRAQGCSTDLCLAKYPQLTDLMGVLKNITANELKANMDYDLVYMDEHLAVVCPYNIGASLKFGIDKWCTSNESMFLKALEGTGNNRWAENATDHALYYCRFKGLHTLGHPVNFCAIQISFPQADAQIAVRDARYWDAEDMSTDLPQWLAKMEKNKLVTKEHFESFQASLKAVTKHFSKFPGLGRVVTSFAGD